jgi:hypothetical protein
MISIWIAALWALAFATLGLFAGTTLERRAWEEKERLRKAPPCQCSWKPGNVAPTKDLIHCGECGGRLPC